jgi:hypothetical protein
MPTAVDIDVTPLGPRRERRRKTFRIVFGVAGIALVAAWVAALLYEFSTHVAPEVFTQSSQTASPTTYENWGLFVALGLLAGVAVWACLVLGARGAARVAVDGEGVRFTWRSGRVTALLWNDPQFHLDLWVVPKASETPEALQVAARAKLRFHGATDLTEEAFEAILDEAGAHGLTISKRRWHGVFPSDPVSTLMIRPHRA